MIAYLTDVEGRWEKLESFARDNPAVSLVGDRLELAPGATFIFGGDAVDRGPASRRVVAILLDARQRYGERVVLLAGNRDMNKLRLRAELGGRPPARAPAELRSPVELLQWILPNSMGARGAFEHARTELRAAGLPCSDEEVTARVQADLLPDGQLTRYLAQCQLACRAGSTLFVHGAITGESLGRVPGRSTASADVDAWIAALNAFYREGIDAYRSGHARGETPDLAQAVIDYQAPVRGTRGNQASVVYGRTANENNDPRLPEEAVVEALQAAGIDRLVVGHTPSGDLPSVLRQGRFTLVMADNSYGRVERGSQVLIDAAGGLELRGACRLDDGRELELAFRADDAPVGLCTADTGHLIKAPLTSTDGDDAWLLFRALPELQMEQVAGPIEGRPRRVPASL